MASKVSVSKGVFVFKNGAKAATKRSHKKNKTSESVFCDSLWYKTYKSLWNLLEEKIEDLNNQIFSNVLRNLVNYIGQTYKSPVTEIPAAALLTGINMPDHCAQFSTLQNEIKDNITPHVISLKADDCQNLKYLVESLTLKLVNNESQSCDEDSDRESPRIKKSQCNFAFLQSWYEELYIPATNNSPQKKLKTKQNRKIIVVIISDFESFPTRVLQDFILIVSSYINVLPFVLVFGVATSLNAVHRALPCHVSSKVNIHVFNSSPSTVYLNSVVENVLFSIDCPFQLGGKVFNLFTDIFLFYDLSVSGFIRNFKYAMLEHFSYGNATALCQLNKVKHIIADFNHSDFENVRRLLSFRKLVEQESAQNRIRLLTDDDYFAKILNKEIKKIRKYIPCLHLFLKCLHVLVCDLPRAPLGKQVRELYAIAVTTNITKSDEYKECFQLLSFQSKDELCNKISKIIGLLSNNGASGLHESKIESIITSLTDYVNKLNYNELESEESDNEDALTTQVNSRKNLREQLITMSKQHKSMNNKYESIRVKIIDFLSEQFELYLREPSSFYFYEIFFFDDISIQNHIIGTHRAAIHTALNDPHFYLQCNCCEIPNDSIILQSMPDISIAYKLHLECGKMINLYDWLQAFVSIVDPQKDDDEETTIHPELQARFTQAVAELEYLGFIKTSKRKTDHVARLTWGG